MEIRKVPAAAGAEWLLGAFRLLKKSPTGFGLLAVIYAAVWLAMAVLAAHFTAATLLLQIVSMIVGALLVALMIYAAQEVDAGRNASPGALLAGMRGGNGERMLRTLVPQAIFALAIAGLVSVLIGQENLVKAMEIMADMQAKAQDGIQVDPATIMEGPVARVAFGGLFVMAIAVVCFVFTMTLLPDMLLADRRLGDALRRSATAGLRNLAAMLIYLILGFVLMMTISIGAGVILGFAQLILGPAAVVAGNALLYGILMNLLAGAMYFAWKQMLGAADVAASSEPPGVAM